VRQFNRINSDLEEFKTHKEVVTHTFVAAYLTRFPSLRSKWYFEHKNGENHTT
jgi:hypothetical protein